jgi:hypothetical protein
MNPFEKKMPLRSLDAEWAVEGQMGRNERLWLIV